MTSDLDSKNCGKDASEAFWNYHSEKVLKSVADEYKIGEGESGAENRGINKRRQRN